MISEEAAPVELQAAVESTHGGRATLRYVAPVRETFQGQAVWEGIVHVFDLEGHQQTDTCYAWSSAVEDSDKRRFYAVLKIPPIDSPKAAVRAAIVADHKAGRST